MERHVHVQGHRGACGYAPENTLAAFRLAREMGADGIECDIHLSKDGRFVVCHDETIDRTSTGSGKIAELTLAEIQSCDFGAKFGAQFAGITAPALEEMLEVVKGMNPINIEIKQFGKDRDTADALNAFYDILASFDVLPDVIVSSFDAELLRMLKRLHPDVYTCLLYSTLRGAAARAQALGCSAIHPNHSKLSKATVNSAHRRGLKVNCWTVNEARDIRRMIEIGCDGLITNYPDRALAIIKEV